MQGIYDICETNHVSRITEPQLQCAVHVMLLLTFNVLHFPKFACSAQYGCFLYFLDFVLSRYIAQVPSEWFWDGYSCSYCYFVTSVFTLHMRRIYTATYLCFRIFSTSFLITYCTTELVNSLNVLMYFSLKAWQLLAERMGKNAWMILKLFNEIFQLRILRNIKVIRLDFGKKKGIRNRGASHFKVVSYHLPALRYKTHENLRQDY